MSSIHLERQINSLANSTSKSVLIQAYQLYCRGYPTSFSLSALMLAISYAQQGHIITNQSLQDLTKSPVNWLEKSAS